jgi:hypothetical protein
MNISTPKYQKTWQKFKPDTSQTDSIIPTPATSIFDKNMECATENSFSTILPTPKKHLLK